MSPIWITLVAALAFAAGWLLRDLATPAPGRCVRCVEEDVRKNAQPSGSVPRAREDVLTLHWGLAGAPGWVSWEPGASLHTTYVAEAAALKMGELSRRPASASGPRPRYVHGSARCISEPERWCTVDRSCLAPGCPTKAAAVRWMAKTSPGTPGLCTHGFIVGYRIDEVTGYQTPLECPDCVREREAVS